MAALARAASLLRGNSKFAAVQKILEEQLPKPKAQATPKRAYDAAAKHAAKCKATAEAAEAQVKELREKLAEQERVWPRRRQRRSKRTWCCPKPSRLCRRPWG